jgi:hypothetical protein
MTRYPLILCRQAKTQNEKSRPRVHRIVHNVEISPPGRSLRSLLAWSLSWHYWGQVKFSVGQTAWPVSSGSDPWPTSRPKPPKSEPSKSKLCKPKSVNPEPSKLKLRKPNPPKSNAKPNKPGTNENSSPPNEGAPLKEVAPKSNGWASPNLGGAKRETLDRDRVLDREREFDREEWPNAELPNREFPKFDNP